MNQYTHPEMQKIVAETHPTTRGATNHTKRRKAISTLTVLERHTSTSDPLLLRPYTPELVLAFLLYLQTHLREDLQHVFHHLWRVTASDCRLVHRAMMHP